jgi:HYR domain
MQSTHRGSTMCPAIAAKRTMTGLACTPPSGAGFPLGVTTVSCEATDASGNTGTVTFHVTVAYAWSGIRQPINADGSSIFKAGSTVPVKFALSGPSAAITDAAARLTFTKLTSGIEGTVVEAITNVTATSGNLFRYDPTDQQYIFNWSTKGLSSGTYVLKIDLGDGITHAIHLSLK